MFEGKRIDAVFVTWDARLALNSWFLENEVTNKVDFKQSPIRRDKDGCFILSAIIILNIYAPKPGCPVLFKNKIKQNKKPSTAGFKNNLPNKRLFQCTTFSNKEVIWTK